MTVIKTPALGSARKSLGDLNYYRVRGVQLVRKKAVFTPGRTFTTAQLKQQSKMLRAQSLLHAFGFEGLVNCTNVDTNRKFSQTSRVNRFIGKAMNYSSVSVPSSSLTETQITAYNARTILSDWSLGSLAMPSKIDLSITYDSGTTNVVFTNLKPYAKIWLDDFNSTRSANGQLSYANIGVLGWLQDPDGSSPALACFGVTSLFLDDPNGVSDPLLVLDLDSGQNTEGFVFGSFVFCLTEETLDDHEYTGLRALRCTRSTPWLDLSVSNGGGDRPTVQ